MSFSLFNVFCQEMNINALRSPTLVQRNDRIDLAGSPEDHMHNFEKAILVIKLTELLVFLCGNWTSVTTFLNRKNCYVTIDQENVLKDKVEIFRL